MKKLVGWLLVVAMLLTLGWVVMKRLNEAPLVSVVEAKTSTVTETVYVSGSVVAAKEYALYGPSGARVSEVLVKTGEKVAKGTKLAAFDDSDIRSQIGQARNQLQILNIQLRAYEKSKDSIPGSVQTGPLSMEDQINIEKLQIKNQEELIQSLERTLTKYTLFAPVSGVLGSVNLVVGQLWQGVQPALVVLDDHIRKVHIWLNPIDALKVQVGQRAIIYFGDSTLNGTVTFVGKAAVNGSVPAEIASGSLDIPLGASVDVEVVTREVRGVTVPASCLIYQADGSYVVKVVEGGVVKTKKVEIGAQSASEVVISSGLIEGESVLTDHLDVKDGHRVRVH